MGFSIQITNKQLHPKYNGKTTRLLQQPQTIKSFSISFLLRFLYCFTKAPDHTAESERSHHELELITSSHLQTPTMLIKFCLYHLKAWKFE